MYITSLLKQLRLSTWRDGEIAVARERFAATAQKIDAAGVPLVFMYATDERPVSKGFAVHAVFSLEDGFMTLATSVPENDPHYPSLTATVMAAHWFERLICDQFGIVADGHPDMRRLVHHENIPADTHPLCKDFSWDTKLPHAQEPYPMHVVEGEGVYEIPVGPIHAGIIEPGHFRFNVRGERILSLEGKLFFKHKGVEKLVEGKMPQDALPFVERISGDMVVGHTLPFVQAVERAAGAAVPERVQALRVVWSELERVTMHVFDIGNIAGNGTGFTFMAAQGFRLVEDMRRLCETLTGHRFLRGAITLGGAHDLDVGGIGRVLQTLDSVEREMKAILDIAFLTDGLMERFETTGVLSETAARAYGARGVAARASGIATDFRVDHPYAAYEKYKPAVAVQKAGDVAARFRVRARELVESIRIIRAVLEDLPKGAVSAKVPARGGEALGWSEAWRGAVIDFVRLDAHGRIDRLAVSDPSFTNWPLFGEIGPGNIVPDFPLCNKSLNLSYSGTDL